MPRNLLLGSGSEGLVEVRKLLLGFESFSWYFGIRRCGLKSIVGTRSPLLGLEISGGDSKPIDESRNRLLRDVKASHGWDPKSIAGAPHLKVKRQSPKALKNLLIDLGIEAHLS